MDQDCVLRSKAGCWLIFLARLYVLLAIFDDVGALNSCISDSTPLSQAEDRPALSVLLESQRLAHLSGGTAYSPTNIRRCGYF
jgi:hypothetical protein